MAKHHNGCARLAALAAGLVGALGAHAVTVQEVMTWHELGMPAAAISQRVARSQPPTRFTAEDLAKMAQVGAPPALLAAIRTQPAATPPAVSPTPPGPPATTPGREELRTAFMLDFEEPTAIGQIEVFLTRPTPHPPQLAIMVSNDGKTWRTIYAHDRKAFGGTQPLTIKLPHTVTRMFEVRTDPDTLKLFDHVSYLGGD